jgi:hypothetical protein
MPAFQTATTATPPLRQPAQFRGRITDQPINRKKKRENVTFCNIL